MEYIANELMGRVQGKMIYVKADTIEEAMKKLNVDDSIPYYDTFKKPYGKLYELHETGKPYNSRIIHISGDI